MTVVPDAAIVRVELPDPVRLAGANVQVVAAGSPEQENEIAPLKAFSPFTKMDADPDPPASTVIDWGATVRVKSGIKLIVYVAEATSLGE